MATNCNDRLAGLEFGAREAIEQAEAAGMEYARLAAHEMDLEHDRAAVKADAIARIMASGDNPLTQKPHSASSADAVVTTDHEYRTHLRAQSDTVLAKNRLFAEARSAQLRAELAIALIRAREGVVA